MEQGWLRTSKIETNLESSFTLYVVPCTDDREEVADHVCPLRLQMAWSAPDHVFRLCRRPTEVKEDEQKDTLDGWLAKYFEGFRWTDQRKCMTWESEGLL